MTEEVLMGTRTVKVEEEAPTGRQTMNLDAAAKILGIGRQTAYQLARESKFPGALHLGRRIVVSRVQLEEFLRGRADTTSHGDSDDSG